VSGLLDLWVIVLRRFPNCGETDSGVDRLAGVKTFTPCGGIDSTQNIVVLNFGQSNTVEPLTS